MNKSLPVFTLETIFLTTKPLHNHCKNLRNYKGTKYM